ncbi:hypothetical protein [Novosphingobium indicum]|nr:hypothetical protein [Novosphingobium indicum]
MTDRAKILDDLRREVDRICEGKGDWQDITKPKDYREFTPAPRTNVETTDGRTLPPAERGPFGRWLVRQPSTGILGALARAAKADPRFPLDGDPEAVRNHLRKCMADGDMFAAVDDAELDWMSY